MVIYIHGFGGSGEGSKAKAFREYFKSIEEPFIAPSLSYVPELAIRTLEELIESYHRDVKLIGSSMGGYYTMYLAQKYHLQAVLINPSINPHSTLERALGDAPNFYDESHYAWNDTHIEMLKTYRTRPTHPGNFMLLVQKGDELLDYREALEYLPDVKTVVEEGGSHSFDGVERYFENIREFFEVGNHFKHTMRVKGVGFSSKELARRVGDLYYDELSSFLNALDMKLFYDAMADSDRGRNKLADKLFETRKLIDQAGFRIADAWKICEKHTLEWLEKNGDNRKRYIFQEPKIKKPAGKDKFPDIGNVETMPYKAELRELDGWIVVNYLQTGGWAMKQDNITPPPKDARDDKHYLFNKVMRYTALKDDICLFVDVAWHMGDGNTYIHYGDETRKMVEEIILPFVALNDEL